MLKKFFLVIILIILLSNCSINDKLESKSSLHDSVEISSDDYGAVTGTIHTEESTDRIGLILYLGDVITDSNGMFGGFLNPETAPVANYDPNSGEFVFNDVKPGKYSLIIHEVVLGGQAYIDETGNVVIISVEAGNISDIGLVSFEGF